MKVIPTAGPGSPHWVYHVATSCVYSPRLSWASHHTHSTFKLAVGDKKAAISASASSTNPRRKGGTWEQCWYFPERGMEGHQGSTWYSSHLLMLPRVLKMLFSCMECGPFLLQAIGVWFLSVSGSHDKWPFCCLNTHSCRRKKDAG